MALRPTFPRISVLLGIVSGLLFSACHGGPSSGAGGFLRPQQELTGLPYASQSFLTMASQLDTDGDSAISKQELDHYLSQRFLMFDADGDGSVTREEFRSTEERDKTLRRQKHEYFDRSFAKLDADSDGKLTKSELLAGAGERFTRADSNRDGRITAEDYAQSNGPPSQDMRGSRGRGFGGRGGF